MKLKLALKHSYPYTCFFVIVLLLLDVLPSTKVLATHPRSFLALDSRNPGPSTSHTKKEILLQQADAANPPPSIAQNVESQLQRKEELFQAEAEENPRVFIAGLVLVYLSTSILWVVERKAYRIAKRLKNAKEASEEIRVINTEHHLNEELVVARGLLRTFYPLSDKVLGVTVYNSIMLIRHVEIFQLTQGEIEKAPTITLEDSIMETLKSSNKSDNSKIPSWVPYNPNTSHISFIGEDVFLDENARVGSYILSPSQIEQIKERECYSLRPVVQSTIKGNLKHLFDSMQFPYKPNLQFTDKYVYIQQHYGITSVDDLRIWFEYIPCDRVTLVCSLDGNKFIPYDYETKKFRRYDPSKKLIAGDSDCVEAIDNAIDCLSCTNLCNFSKADCTNHVPNRIDWVFFGEMLQKEEAFNRRLGETLSQNNTKWILRGISFHLLVIGLFFLMGPITQNFVFSEAFGLHYAFASIAMAYMLAVIYTMMTWAMAWLFYTPLLSIAFLAMSSLALLAITVVR